VPEIYLVVNREDRNKIQNWLFGNVLRLANGEAYCGLSMVKTKGHAELRCNCDGKVIAEVEDLEDAKALCERLAGILKEAQELDLLSELQERTKELKEDKTQEKLLEISNKITSELKILGMKRAFPGTCPLCPI